MTIGTLESEILARAPKYLRGPNLGRFMRAHGAVMDGNLEALRQGAALGNPWLCPVEQLPTIAKDRSTPIFDNEPEWSKRETLANSMQIARFRGSSRGRIMRLRNFFLGEDGTGSIPTIYDIHRNDGVTWWHWMTPAGKYLYQNDVDNFDYATGDDANWSQTFVIIEMSESDYTAPPKYGQGHLYGNGVKYGTGGANPLPVSAFADLISMAKWAAAAHSWLTAFILNWGTPIDITASPVQDGLGRWSLPNGYWANPVDPSTGFATRPAHMQWIYSNNV